MNFELLLFGSMVLNSRMIAAVFLNCFTISYIRSLIAFSITV